MRRCTCKDFIVAREGMEQRIVSTGMAVRDNEVNGTGISAKSIFREWLPVDFVWLGMTEVQCGMKPSQCMLPGSGILLRGRFWRMAVLCRCSLK